MEKISNRELYQCYFNIINSIELNDIHISSINIYENIISIYIVTKISIYKFIAIFRHDGIELNIDNDTENNDKNIKNEYIKLSEKMIENEGSILDFIFDNIQI